MRGMLEVNKHIHTTDKESKVKEAKEEIDNKINSIQIQQVAIFKIQDREIVEEDNKEVINRIYSNNNNKSNLILKLH